MLTPIDLAEPREPTAIQRELSRPIMRALFVVFMIEIAVVVIALTWISLSSPAAVTPHLPAAQPTVSALPPAHGQTPAAIENSGRGKDQSL